MAADIRLPTQSVVRDAHIKNLLETGSPRPVKSCTVKRSRPPRTKISGGGKALKDVKAGRCAKPLTVTP